MHHDAVVVVIVVCAALICPVAPVAPVFPAAPSLPAVTKQHASSLGDVYRPMYAVYSGRMTAAREGKMFTQSQCLCVQTMNYRQPNVAQHHILEVRTQEGYDPQIRTQPIFLCPQVSV